MEIRGFLLYGKNFLMKIITLLKKKGYQLIELHYKTIYSYNWGEIK